ncbi:MAG: hypothetical protein K2X93_22420 [Candidatus Obscuribacterales bacterium]|nr:hypothetical protein [Candidatus Obscuribacterales bacterium]
MKTFNHLLRNFEWDTAMILLCFIGLVLMDFVVLRDFFSVSIVRVPVNLIVKTSTPEQSPSVRVIKPLCADGPVTWTFKCATEMSYSYLWKEKTGNRWTVCIRIDSANVRLSLPIEIYLPIDPPVRLEQHSKGHVLICEQVYQDAENYARSNLNSVFHRTYIGEGDTVDEAGANAVGIATAEFAEAYKEQTQTKAQDISDLYDFLELKRPESYKTSVESAVAALRKGRVRRL